MSSSLALSCLSSVKKQKHDLLFLFRSMYNLQLVYSVFVIFRIIKFKINLGWDYQPKPKADTSTWISRYHNSLIQ